LRLHTNILPTTQNQSKNSLHHVILTLVVRNNRHYKYTRDLQLHTV